MKKIIALILSLVMMLCAMSATAAEKTTLGSLTVNGDFRLQCGLPEGYKTVPLTVTQEQIVTKIQSEDPNAPVIQVSIAYDEKYYDVERLNDLDQEALQQLEQTFIDNDPIVEITYGETGYGTRLLIARHDTDTFDYFCFFSIFRGYCVEFVLTPSETAEDKNLTDAQMENCIRFLTELDFIPIGTDVTGEQAVAGLTFTTNLSNYDPETNMVTAEVMRPIPLSAAQAEALQVGDTLIDGQFEEVIETIDTSEEGSILINDDIELRKNGEEYQVFVNEAEYIEFFVELQVTIPDNLKIVDYIDKETGEALEEPVIYTVEEFKAMLADAELSPDFATNNVKVAFNVNREMVLVERFYTPWQ